MPRPRLQPLTDDQGRCILAGVAELDESLPNPAYLVEFIGLVARATGGYFGVKRYRDLLAAYAPGRTPSSTTINTAIKVAKAGKVKPAEPARVPEQGASPRAKHAQQRMDFDHRAALQMMEFELDHYRTRAKTLEQELVACEGRLDAMTLDAARATSRADAIEAQNTVLIVRLEELANHVKAATDDASGARAFALRAIDASRAETRSAVERTVAASKQVDEQREMIALLKQALRARNG